MASASDVLSTTNAVKRPIDVQRCSRLYKLTTTSKANAKHKNATVALSALTACICHSLRPPRQARSTAFILPPAPHASRDGSQAPRDVLGLAFVEHHDAARADIEQRSVVSCEYHADTRFVDVAQ